MAGYPQSIVCRVIGVTQSGYRKHSKSKVTKDDEERSVINCFEQNKGRYGRKRIKESLKRKSIKISEKRISEILKKNGLSAKCGRKKKNRVKKEESEFTAENLIKNKFEVKRVNELWCSDITELVCKSGKLYVCGIIDVYSRKIVSINVKKHQRQELVQEAIDTAGRRYRPTQTTFHSDRGSQYTALKTKALIEGFWMKSSMSRPGRPNDNQPIESFWLTLSKELDVKNESFGSAKRLIENYVHIYYNTQRLHSSLGYKTPNEVFLDK